MHDETYARIQANPNFQDLVSRRDRFAWTLSAIMLGLGGRPLSLVSRQARAACGLPFSMPCFYLAGSGKQHREPRSECDHQHEAHGLQVHYRPSGRFFVGGQGTRGRA